MLSRTLPPITPTTEVTPGARLVGPDGEDTPLSSEVYDGLRRIVEALRSGHAVTVSEYGAQLTTQQAAEILGVTRPTLVKILEAGEIPFTTPGRHRRVHVADVLAYRERRRSTRREGLQALVETSEELGLYDDGHDSTLRR